MGSLSYNIKERIGYRRKTALYLIDIEYFQEENINSDKSILWNCFGDVLYENLIFNLKHKPEKLFAIKKNAYKKSDQREKEINDMVESVQEEMFEKKKVSIMDYEYSWINNLLCRKGSESDRYLLYLLLVLYKRKKKYIDGLEDQDSITDDNRNHFKIYNNARYKKVTRNTLDHWLDRVIAKKGIERFVKKEIIKKIIYCDSYDKIYLNLPKEPQSVPKELFSVTHSNPMIDYYIYSGEKIIKKCTVCNKDFVVEGGNVKTCSLKCSRINELRNKNK